MISEVFEEPEAVSGHLNILGNAELLTDTTCP